MPSRHRSAVIADQVRIRRGLHPLSAIDETVADLKILTGRRMDPVSDRTRTVNRLRSQLTGTGSAVPTGAGVWPEPA
ncbi:transposase [Streptomyces sp. NPDC056831]|uniref:IS110 family transposase n=1 Tax=Streptomyces sp. NPDC056831 TaxID=3345954 RepID=UPI00369DDEEB